MASVEYDFGRSRAVKMSDGYQRYEEKALTSTESTIPNQLSSNTEGTGNTEQDRIELHLLQTVVSQKNTGVGIDIRPRVLRFASLKRALAGDIARKQHDSPQGECWAQSRRFDRQA